MTPSPSPSAWLPGGAPTSPPAVRAVGLAVLGLAVAAALWQARLAAKAPPAAARAAPRRRTVPALAGRVPREARGLHGAAALLATSVLADSAIEHYRGAFENPGMYTPLVTSALTLLAGTQGAASGSTRAQRARDGAYATAAAVGTVGAGFHAYNIAKRPGGVSWLNLFYAAPFGAPLALSLAGVLGLAADRLRLTARGTAARLLGLPAGRALAALASVGLGGTVGEAGLLHFRGAFQNPFMWLPVTVPPVAAALLAEAAARGGGSRQRLARAWLAATALLGIGGMGFHAYGVSRAMGGWRNWSQNLVDGPPLPAPPSFSALAIAGLSALSLMRRDERDPGAACDTDGAPREVSSSC